MKLSDEKVVEFLAKSPLKTFTAMLDTLRYLDSLQDTSVSAECEYELFNEPLGDNRTGEVSIRVPKIGGTTTAALFVFLDHAQKFDLVRRRPKLLERTSPEPEMRVLYQLTPSGSYIIKVLEALSDVSSIAEVSLPSA